MKSYSESIKAFLKERNVSDNPNEKYAILEFPVESPDGKPVARVSPHFLSSCYDVQFSEPPQKIPDDFIFCSNQKCKLELPKSCRFCPNCGRKNQHFQHKKVKK